ncbi:hypothetical protein Zm00014a_002187 [Zea mays]|uniref:Uncharacterized protein n=1 Tax=Zea mays TaxID=4577 RepID=A0A3L6FF50_MAIZE|nr:hypothetical protein Zm00014a_002187 [Zea mays]
MARFEVWVLRRRRKRIADRGVAPGWAAVAGISLDCILWAPGSRRRGGRFGAGWLEILPTTSMQAAS